MDTAVIVTEQLSKRFHARQFAVNAVDLAVFPGSISGIVGTNGAGKTTLLHMLVGLLRPTSGKAFVLGADIASGSAEYRQHIGFISDQAYFPTGFTAADVLKYHRFLYNNWDGNRARRLMDAFALPLHQRVRQLSKGMKVQLAFVAALSIRPKALILDESTGGLDPVVKRQVLQLLVQEASEGTAVLFATHHLEELERIADQIYVLHEGRIVTRASTDELKAAMRRIQVVFAQEFPEELRHLPGIIAIEEAGHVYTLTVKGQAQDIMALCRRHQPLLLEELTVGFEDMFVHLMNQEGYSREQISLV